MAVASAITNQAFAEKVGCHHSMASRLLNGQRLPSVELMNEISKAFDIPMADLVAARLEGADKMGQVLRTRTSPGA